MYILNATEMRQNYWYVTFYVFWAKFLLVEFIPYILMVGMNYLIWKRIKKLARVGRQVESGATGKRKGASENCVEKIIMQHTNILSLLSTQTRMLCT